MGNHPGRIVMLVQNGVTGDSRVQKEAASAAAAGWEVFLLGRSDGRPEEWSLGGATVRLVPTQRTFDLRRHEVRRPWLRGPLSYPPGPLESYRRKQVQAWKADLAFERARLAAGAGGPAARLAHGVRRAGFGTASLWIRARTRASRLARERRAGAASPLDRAAFGFWKGALGDRSWRRLDPALWDLELAFGPVIDELAPDLIHANDFQMLGVGARAKVRAAAKGRDVKLVWDAHEFLPGMKPWKDHPWWHAAQVAHEREYAPYADAVVTVAEPLAELLVTEHGLTEPPAIVMNTPDFDGGAGTADPEGHEDVPDLRELCGVEKDTPLMIYSGVPLVQRGIHIMVEALPALPEVHAALVLSKHHWAYVRSIMARADELGVADRVHLLPHVPHHQVVRFVAAADIGVSPNHHHQNHEISLNTKFFDYSHARLPMVVSDVKTIAATVRETGQGEVFRAEDTEDFVRAVKRVLADPEAYRRAYDERVPLQTWTWKEQARVLTGVYERLIGSPGNPGAQSENEEPRP